MRTRNLIFSVFTLLLFASFAYAQVSGVVVDDFGPVPGAQVTVSETGVSTETGDDGAFTINAAVGNTLIILNPNTLAEKNFLVNGPNLGNLQLGDAAIGLQDVVAVAFGTQTRESLVGAVNVVGEEVLDNIQATNVATALQGTVAGVGVITSGGIPGETPQIRIRGIGSLNSGASPLIILDGNPFNGNLSSITQDQIESYSVLKDASATALYGSRASNGVIIITTKKGKRGKPVVNAESKFGVGMNAVDFHETVGAAEYMELAWESMRNFNVYGQSQSFDQAAQNATNNLILSLGYNPFDVANPVGTNGRIVDGANLMWDTDWFDALTRPVSTRFEQSADISGGGDYSNYFFSVNYLKEEGNVRTTAFERISSRFNINTDIKDWLRIGGNVGFSTSHSNVPTQSGTSYQSPMQWVYSVANIYPIYVRDANGNLLLDSNGGLVYDYGNNAPAGQPVNGRRPVLSGENALGALYNYNIKNRRNYINLGGFGEVDLAEGLTFRSQLGYEYYLFDYFEFSSPDYGNAATVGGRVEGQKNNNTTLNAVQKLTYETTFGEAHDFAVDAIYESYQYKYDALSSQGTGLLPGISVLSGAAVPESIGGYTVEERLLGAMGRLRYDYDEKYFLEGSYRKDGSSRFSQETRWGDFFSIGAAWVISNEAFLEGSNVVDLLKIRGSYGETGNNNILGAGGGADYFPYIAGFNIGWDNGANSGILVGAVPDPLLTWEKSASQNYGVDFELWNRRVFGNVDYFTRESIDLIYNAPLPPSTGNTTILTNVGAVKNSGWEVLVGASPVKSEDFELTTSVNFSLIKNEITELTQDQSIQGTKLWKVGNSVYDFYLQEWAGVDPATGEALWYMDVLDAEGNVVGRDVTSDYSLATRYDTDKSSLPDVQGGWTTTARYKNFDFFMLWNFSFGGYIYDYEYAGLMNSLSTLGDQVHGDMRDRWQQPGDITNVPRLYNTNHNYNSLSTRFLFNNDYMRMKAINVGYNFHSNVAERIGLNGLRIYFQGDNLFTWQSHKGIDPEQSFTGLTNNRSYQNKTYSFGFRLSF